MSRISLFGRSIALPTAPLTIFGREPALWLGLLAAALKLGTAFGLDLTGDQQSVINAAAAAMIGVAVAVLTHDGISAAILGGAQALLALGLGFGLHVSGDQQAVIMAFVAVAISMFVRTQVTAPVPGPDSTSDPDPGTEVDDTALVAG